METYFSDANISEYFFWRVTTSWTYSNSFFSGPATKGPTNQPPSPLELSGHLYFYLFFSLKYTNSNIQNIFYYSMFKNSHPFLVIYSHYKFILLLQMQNIINGYYDRIGDFIDLHLKEKEADTNLNNEFFPFINFF